ncbi:MAG TPA: hypothetical protein PKY87_02850 [Terricaulis sp.]|nr:hypothetical protein [Terricaulis sp.]
MKQLACLVALMAAACAGTPAPDMLLVDGEMVSVHAARQRLAQPLPPPTAEQLASARSLHPTDLRLADVAWAQRPEGNVYGAVYPYPALLAGLGGQVELDCLIQEDSRLACAVRSETPPEHGFADAARQIAAQYKVPEQAEGGAAFIGRVVFVPINFQTP